MDIKIKSYTSLEQSKKLAEFLPIESADMEYIFLKKDNSPIGTVPFVKDNCEIENSAFDYDYNRIPCWSLAALLSVLPKGVKSPFGEINPFIGQVGIEDYRCVYLDGDWDSNIQTFANNPVDACYEMILKLHEKKIL